MGPANFRIEAGGLRPLSIGMRRAEIDAVLGESPRADRAGLKGEEAFRYDSSYVRVVLREARAVEIALVPPSQVIFRGKSLFEDASVWRDIVEADGDAQEALGFIILRNLRLTLTGFHDYNRAQLAITAFEAGRWNALEGEMRRFRL